MVNLNPVVEDALKDGNQKMSRLPHQISTQELLDSLEEKKEQVSEENKLDFEFKNDVPKFLSHFKLEAGNNPVQKNLVRRLYLQYSKEKVDPKEFGSSICIFVQHTKHNYLLNITQVELYKLLVGKPKLNRFNIGVPSTRKHFETFLEDTKIVSGNRWIMTKFIYAIYVKYCRANRKLVRFTNNNFARICRLYFEYKQSMRNDIYIKVNENILENLTEKEIQKVKDGKKKKKVVRRIESEEEPKDSI